MRSLRFEERQFSAVDTDVGVNAPDGSGSDGKLAVWYRSMFFVVRAASATIDVSERSLLAQ